MIKEALDSPTASIVENRIVAIKNFLATDLSWLERAYGLAFVGEREELKNVNGKDVYVTSKFPRIYINDGKSKYVELHPDQSLKSYCFFELEGDYRTNFIDREITATINIIFWGNLKGIDKRDYDFKSELVADTIRSLEVCKANISEVRVTENFEDIYRRYSYNQTDNQFFMYPFTSFKVSFEIKQDLGCLPKFNPINC